MTIQTVILCKSHVCVENNKIIIIIIHVLFHTGNLTVVITILRFMNKENVTNIFIINLTVSDIIVIFFALPMRVRVMFYIFELLTHNATILT